MKKHIRFVETDHVQILLIMLIAALFAAAYAYQVQRDELKEAKEQVETLTSEKAQLVSEKDDLNSRISYLEDSNDRITTDALRDAAELDFWQQYAVIVTEEGKKYHHYGCGHIEGRDFYILNIDEAEAEGYTPCLDCCG